MNDSNSKILIFLGAVISVLLVVLIAVLLSANDPPPEPTASTTSAFAATTAATAPPAISATTSPPATAATTTSPPATSATTMTSVTTATTAAPTTTAAPGPVYLHPDGFGPIVVATDESELVANGDLVFDGWDATDPPDGYWCGWGSGAGPQAGLVRAQIFDFGIGVIFAIHGSVTTPEGIGLGSSEVDIVAAYGPPDQEHAGPYDPNERWIYYQVGGNGYKFIFQVAGGPVAQMYAGDYEKLHLGEGCL